MYHLSAFGLLTEERLCDKHRDAVPFRTDAYTPCPAVVRLRKSCQSLVRFHRTAVYFAVAVRIDVVSAQLPCILPYRASFEPEGGVEHQDDSVPYYLLLHLIPSDSMADRIAVFVIP